MLVHASLDEIVLCVCVCVHTLTHCRLIKLSEQIEVIESTIQLRRSSLNLSDRLKAQSDQLFQKLALLSAPEAHTLLLRYVDKVIMLRMVEEKQHREVEEMRVRLGKEWDKVHMLEQSLKKMFGERAEAAHHQLLSN